MNEKTKTLVTNILTLVTIVAVIVGGYFVIKKDIVAPSVDDATAKSAAQTVAAGFEIDRTIRELGDLQEAVVNSVAIFHTNEFKDLVNFSVIISPENIGRTNPFTPTAWSIKMQAVEESVSPKGLTRYDSVESKKETQSERVSQPSRVTPDVAPSVTTPVSESEDLEDI